MNKIAIYLFVIITFGFSSCSKFLEEYSQNLAYAKTATDLNELLVGDGYMEVYGNSVSSAATMVVGTETAEPNCPWLQVMDDDASEFATGTTTTGSPFPVSLSTPINMLSGFYGWQASPFVKADGTILVDYAWKRFYKHIAVVNTILYKADQLMSSASVSDKILLKKVKGEAYFLRAGYYFLLENIYGKPYAKTTAATDAGVPLKITPFVDDKFYSRDAVGTVYNQIIADLKNAAVCLNGIKQPSNYRANKAAAYTLLSRVYLHMEEYQLSINAADSVINSGLYSIVDLNSFTVSSSTSFTAPKSTETIFSQGGYAMNLIQVNDNPTWNISNQSHSYKVSDDLFNAYSSTDLRLNAFFKKSSSQQVLQAAKSTSTSTDGTISDIFLLRLSEVYLNKAEAQALLNKDADAITTLQILRANRFKSANLTTISQTGEALVNFIRDERRRELCFEGQRWFDLRRYAVNSKYPFSKTIRHTHFGYNSGIWPSVGYYELKPYAQDMAAYIMPIPSYAIVFNQGTLTNEVRPVRAINK